MGLKSTMEVTLAVSPGYEIESASDLPSQHSSVFYLRGCQTLFVLHLGHKKVLYMFDFVCSEGVGVVAYGQKDSLDCHPTVSAVVLLVVNKDATRLALMIMRYGWLWVVRRGEISNSDRRCRSSCIVYDPKWVLKVRWR